jgi:hypothetical protein
MVEAAHTACRIHPHWKAELARLEPRLGYNKAIVAVARKLLVSVWHILSEECADRFAVPELVARKLLQFAYDLGRARRPQGQTPAQFVRQQSDRLGLGTHLTAVAWGKRRAVPFRPRASAPPARPIRAGRRSRRNGTLSPPRLTLTRRGRDRGADRFFFKGDRPYSLNPSTA